jgi:hypothetical protein
MNYSFSCNAALTTHRIFGEWADRKLRLWPWRTSLTVGNYERRMRFESLLIFFPHPRLLDLKHS